VKLRSPGLCGSSLSSSGYYDPAAEQIIAWNDPEIAAAWPTKTPIVSSKDARGMTLAEYRMRPAFP